MSIAVNSTQSGVYNARLLNHTYGLFLKTALDLGPGPAFGRRYGGFDDVYISARLYDRLTSHDRKIGDTVFVAKKQDSTPPALPTDLWSLYMFDTNTVDPEIILNMAVFLRDQLRFRIATALLAQANIDCRTLSWLAVS